MATGTTEKQSFVREKKKRSKRENKTCNEIPGRIKNNTKKNKNNNKRKNTSVHVGVFEGLALKCFSYELIREYLGRKSARSNGRT